MNFELRVSDWKDQDVKNFNFSSTIFSFSDSSMYPNTNKIEASLCVFKFQNFWRMDQHSKDPQIFDTKKCY